MKWVASSIWCRIWRRAVSHGLEGIDRVCRCRGADIRFEAVAAHDIHRAVEQTFNIFLQARIIIDRDAGTPISPARLNEMAPARRHSLVSGACADQNEQPKAESDVFIASMVCLQVASMVAFVLGFLDMSVHALRVWSICVLYIARCSAGILETTQLSYLVRKSSQVAIPVLCACAAVTPASKAMPMMPARDNTRFVLEPAAAFDVA